MKDLLHLEFRRLFRAKSFYICTAIALVMIVISAATTKMLLDVAEKATEDIAEAFGGAMLQAPTAFSMLKTAASSSLTTILAVFLSLFVTEDYSSDTIKNVYAKGHSRDEVYFAKYISALAASLMMILVTAAFSFVMGKALFGEFGTMGENYVGSLLAELVILIAYVTVYFAIAISIKKTGASIAISIIAPLLVTLLLSLGNAAIDSETIDLSEYWLDGRLSLLLPSNVETTDMIYGFVLGAVYLVAASGVGFLINRKSQK